MTTKLELSQLIRDTVAADAQAASFREPVIGFSSALDPSYATLPQIVGPWIAPPQFFLPAVETILSFFIPFAPEIAEANQHGSQPARSWAKSYIDANLLIEIVSQTVIRHLAARGIVAASIPPTHTYDEKTLTSAWSHRSAAYIAGLGSFGVNRMLITKKGCAGRFGSILLAIPLEPDAPSAQENCLYYRDGSCLVCLAQCPTGALRLDGFDKFLCNAKLLQNAAEFSDLGWCDVCGKCLAAPCAVLEK
ncbi:MAG: epoxyqueuosine reductase [Negativicutes bacterium]|nr:epoxyqueuosine reductase [Negativicutes bacterium]